MPWSFYFSPRVVKHWVAVMFQLSIIQATLCPSHVAGCICGRSKFRLKYEIRKLYEHIDKGTDPNMIITSPMASFVFETFVFLAFMLLAMCALRIFDVGEPIQDPFHKRWFEVTMFVIWISF